MPKPDPSACVHCPVSPRRRLLLGHLSGLALSALVGGVPVGAAPIVEIASTAASGQERRYPMPSTDGVSIDRGEQVILVRSAGRVYAFNLSCPHENTALRWREKDGRFQCPKHESKYSPDGTFRTGRATRNMDRFAVRRDGDNVVVDLNHLLRSDQQSTEWAAASIAVS